MPTWTFVKKGGAPAGSLNITIGNDSFQIDDTTNTTITTTNQFQASELLSHPYLQQQGGTGNLPAPNVIESVQLVNGVLSKPGPNGTYIPVSGVSVSSPSTLLHPQAGGWYGGLPIVTQRQGNPMNYGLTSGPRNTRVRHVLTHDVVEICLVYTNWSVTTHTEISGAQAIVVTAGVEVNPGNATFAQLAGTTIPVTFQGAASVTIAVDGIAVSDPIPINGSKGDAIYSRTHMTGTSIIGSCRTIPGNHEGIDTNAGDESTSGTITEQAATGCGPTSIIGVTKYQQMPPTVVALGDSVLQVGDTNDFGWLIRYGNTNNVPIQMFGTPGELGNQFTALATSRRRRQLFGAPKYVLCAYGRNDVTGGQTLAQVQATLLSLWSGAAARGCKVFQTTITPRTTTTDNFLTLANQTADATDPVRVALNTWIRAGSPIDPGTLAAVAVGTSGALLAGATNHPLYANTAAPLGYVEVADTVESARNSGLWKVIGTTATGNVTNGSPNVTLTAGAMQNGDAVLCSIAGVPNDTFVLSGGGTNNIVLSANFTGTTTTGVTLTSADTGGPTTGSPHPSQNMHIAIANAVPVNLFA